MGSSCTRIFTRFRSPSPPDFDIFPDIETLQRKQNNTSSQMASPNSLRIPTLPSSQLISFEALSRIREEALGLSNPVNVENGSGLAANDLVELLRKQMKCGEFGEEDLQVQTISAEIKEIIYKIIGEEGFYMDKGTVISHFRREQETNGQGFRLKNCESCYVPPLVASSNKNSAKFKQIELSFENYISFAQTNEANTCCLRNQGSMKIPTLLYISLERFIEKMDLWVGNIRLRGRKASDSVERPSVEIESLNELPAVVYRHIFDLLVSHNQLSADILKLFEGCWIEKLPLKDFLPLDINLFTSLMQFRKITHLDLTNCKNISDDALLLLEAKHFRLSTLILRNCSQITDRSICPLLFAVAGSLKKLDISNCFRLGDRSLNSVIGCQKLEFLDISKVKQFSGPFLCQISMLTNLKVLIMNCCPNVTDEVVDCLVLKNDLKGILSVASKMVAAKQRSSNVNFLTDSEKSDAFLTRLEQNVEQRTLSVSQSPRKKQSNLHKSVERPKLQTKESFHSLPSQLEPEDANCLTNQNRLETKPTGLEKLLRLHLGWTSISDESLGLLRPLKHLEELVVSGCSVSHSGFVAFSGKKGNVVLKRLWADYCDNLGGNLSFFGNFPSLEVLSLRFGPEPMSLPENMIYLQQLDLSHTTADEVIIMDILRCNPPLKKLNLEGCVVSNAVLTTVAKISTLEQLLLNDNCYRGTIDYGVLQALVNLKYLSFFQNNIKANQMQDLCENLTDLESLNIDSRHINHIHLANIEKLTKLRRITGFTARLDIRGLECLIILKSSLIEVCFCSNYITDEALGVLAELENLEKVNISQNDEVTTVGMLLLASKLCKLKHLNISRTNVSEDGVLLLASCVNLEELNIKGLAVEQAAIICLMAHLPKLWHVVK